MDQTYPIFDTTDRTNYIASPGKREYLVKMTEKNGRVRFIRQELYELLMEQEARRQRDMRLHRYGSNPLPSAPPQTPNPPNFQHQPSSTVGQQQPSSRSYQYANNPGIQAQHITNIFRCCTLL